MPCQMLIGQFVSDGRSPAIDRVEEIRKQILADAKELGWQFVEIKVNHVNPNRPEQVLRKLEALDDFKLPEAQIQEEKKQEIQKQDEDNDAIDDIIEEIDEERL